MVTRRGDGYQPLLAKGPMDDRRFPRETIGEIVVVDLRDHLATGSSPTRRWSRASATASKPAAASSYIPG